MTALKLLVARKATSEQHPSPAQLLEEALAAPSSKKKEEGKEKEKEIEFQEPVKQSVPPKVIFLFLFFLSFPHYFEIVFMMKTVLALMQE